jgi:hypothetical protein
VVGGWRPPRSCWNITDSGYNNNSKIFVDRLT